ncbi:MAG: tetratricopeptide repeat protein [Candidatus Sulfobium sp.]|jgi:tetratricopeptide (TPR) repeat protein
MKVDEIFKQGLSFLREDNTLAALACFEKAYDIRKTPEVQSYLAFCISIERGQIREAVRLCEEALSQEPENPSHYLNLGRVYLHAKQKEDALATLRSGAGKDTSRYETMEIKRLLEKLGARRKPVFPFLPRSNFLNKYLGILMHRLGFRQ